MRVLFVYPDFSDGSRGKYCHGLASLSAVLKQGGHSTTLVHIARPLGTSEFESLVQKADPEVMAFSTTSIMFPHAMHYARLARNRVSVPIVFGGIHPTISPEEVIACPEVDMLCVGEGEYPLLDLCDKLSAGEDITRIPNLWIKCNGTVHRNSPRDFIQDLDQLPYPDRALFDYEKLEDARMRRITVIASRGCPYGCSYCCNHKLRSLAGGRYVRFRSAGHVIGEIKQVISDRSVEQVTFHDDILTLNKGWLRQFCREYKAEVNLPFSCNSRVNLLDEEAVVLLKEAGCRWIWMGIESGNDFLRREVLARSISKEQIVRAFALCRKHGIATTSYNMVGLPFEDMSMVLETIKTNVEARPNAVQVSIFFPFYGTELYRLCKAKQLLSEGEVDSVFQRTTLEQSTISPREVAFALRNFRYMVFFLAHSPAMVGRILERLFLKCSPLVSALTALVGLLKPLLRRFRP